MKRKLLALSWVLLLPGMAWGKPLPPRRAPAPASVARPLPARLLTMPPAVIFFGSTPADPTELVRQVSLSATPQIIRAQYPGILEYTYLPASLVAWGAPLYRIYELDLLDDLRRAEESAARIGSQPFVIAPANFPSPLRRAMMLPGFPPPTMPTTPAAVAAVTPPRSAPASPLVRLPRSSGAPEAESASPAPAPAAAPVRKGKSVEQASRDLAAAQDRVRAMSDLLEAARADLKSAEKSVGPLRDDVAARKRLEEIGAIARNDMKAAEERLADAEAGVETAKGRVAEAQTALDRAQGAQEAALTGLDAARSAPGPAEPPPTVAKMRPTPERTAAPPRPVQEAWAPPSGTPGTSPARPSAAVPPGFPSPIVGGPMAGALPVSPPTMSFRLAPAGDVSPFGLWPPLPFPAGVTDLAHPRWHDRAAPEQCVVARSFAPQGARVFKGMPIMEIRPASVARVKAEVAEPYVGRCRVGLPVQVVFPGQGLVFRGWVSHVEPTHSPRPPGASVEMLLVESSTGGDAFAALQWMTLSSFTAPETPEPLTWDPPQPTRPAPTTVEALFPLGPAPTRTPRPNEMPTNAGLSGSMQLVGAGQPARLAPTDVVAEKKLDQLRDWRRSFVEGMKTTVFPETGLTLTYPREGGVSVAVERMATGRVSHAWNMCAATLAEALGWGCGDAAMWARGLPERGYKAREDGIARPGDILVWPFTYGPNLAQHVGIAVGQGGTIMMLSNSGGVLGTKPLLGGYLAFYKPGKDLELRAEDEGPRAETTARTAAAKAQATAG